MMNNSNDNAETEREDELPKLPFKRLKYALIQIVHTAIPMHVQLLKDQNEIIKILKSSNDEQELRSIQIKATKTVHLLKADLFELEKLNVQVREEDSDLFHSYIKNATKDAIEILSIFMDLHSDIFVPLPETSDSQDSVNFPTLVCNVNEETYYVDQSDAQIQAVLDSELKETTVAKSKFEALSYLQKEFLEINALIKQFANLVFRQKESVDTIQENVERTNENVFIGTQYLKKASDYKAASFPIAGAVLGGLILGPAGALAGFKIFGSVACIAGGSIIGYSAGRKLKQKQQAHNEFEMKALTYPEKSKSRSTPDLSAEDNINKN